MKNLTLNDEIQKAVKIAQNIAKEYANAMFSGAHLLRALLHKDLSLRIYLQNAGKDFYFMEDWADVRIEQYPKSARNGEPVADDKVKAVLNEAENIRIKLSKDDIDLVCVFAALCTPGIAFTYEQLKTFPITVSEIIAENNEKKALNDLVGSPAESREKTTTSSVAIAKYCIDKLAAGREGKIDAVAARDQELRLIAEILGRRSKANVIITGEPGTGKTSLVNGLILNILKGDVPEKLAGTLVFELDPGAFIAGASYKGEAEDRMQSIIKELRQFDKVILFIDNIHYFTDKNGPAPGIANMLKSELSKGGLVVIGAVTSENYRKHIEPDESLCRLFEQVKLDEPDEATAARMIAMVTPYFEKHHSLTIANDVIMEAVRLAKRYLKERSLPDSAIDLIDRTMSAIKVMEQTSLKSIEAVKQELTAVNAKTEALTETNTLEEISRLQLQLKNKISPLLYSELAVEAEGGADAGLEKILDGLLIAAAVKRDKIEKADIAAVISSKTGIPLGKLQSNEKDRLENMEDLLKKRVIGQDNAIRAVCGAILESRSGLGKPGQPIGSFFFLGPTGTGKTELAKSLAEFMFNDESALIRFDMSEFKEEHSAALLYGAPPGYVGYEEGGLLVNKIRQKPYAVILFDEIEKAHPSVFDLFLQIMDEGKLHDRLGKEGDFSNAVILFTSNIGSDFVMENFNRNVVPAADDLMEIMTRHFRPEFLARLTEIVPFSPITAGMVYNIFSIHLNLLLKVLDKQGIALLVSEDAKQRLAAMGFTPKYGARPIQGVIRNQVRRPLSKMIIAGDLKKGDTIRLETDEADVLKWTTLPNVPEENSYVLSDKS
jgi:ATP-dependent Clp protease ATP-binding subunit ClpB